MQLQGCFPTHSLPFLNPRQPHYPSLFIYLVDRRNGNSDWKLTDTSGGAGVRTPVMASRIAILAFLPIELGLVDNFPIYLQYIKHT